VKLHLKNNQSKKGWMHGLSSRIPASQLPGPEFNPIVPSKNKNKTTIIIAIIIITSNSVIISTQGSVV
jgi:hypothetical protein